MPLYLLGFCLLLSVATSIPQLEDPALTRCQAIGAPCSDATVGLPFVAGKVHGCRGAFTGGVAGGERLCCEGWHICRNAKEAKALHLTYELCDGLTRKTKEFFSSHQPSEGTHTCSTSGFDDIFGCGDARTLPLFTHLAGSSTCNPFNAASNNMFLPLGGGGSTSAWSCPSCVSTQERLGCQKTSGEGGVLCCRDRETRRPTRQPTTTKKPTWAYPTKRPTWAYTTRRPTKAPTKKPTKRPTPRPTKQPTRRPITRRPTKKPTCHFCGGIAGIPCPDGYTCVDDPSDECDPKHGGADCAGCCVKCVSTLEILCCGGISYDRRPNMACCNGKLYDVTKQICCGGRLYPREDNVLCCKEKLQKSETGICP